MLGKIADNMIGGEGTVFFLAARPSRPRMCRNRRRCQGQALPGRFASLDIRRLASGHRCLRVMDVNASGRGSEHEHPFQSKKPKRLLPFSAFFSLTAFSLSPLSIPRFPDNAFLLSPAGPAAFPVNIMRLPPLRKMFSGSSAFAFLQGDFFFPHDCAFVRHHPGRPAYVTCTRAGARYPLRLARGYAPLTPARPAKGSGLAQGKRRERQ